MSNKAIVGEQICGVCIRACPYGKAPKEDLTHLNQQLPMVSEGLEEIVPFEIDTVDIRHQNVE